MSQKRSMNSSFILHPSSFISMIDQPQPHAMLETLPLEWPTDVRPLVHHAVETSGVKVVVLDDDPTGTQTVYDLAVLTTWSVEALHAELEDPAPCCYILTNTRSVPLDAAQAINAEIGRNLEAAAAATGRRYTVISRGDSTLRGHFPGEVQALSDALGRRADVWLLAPAFFAGGRYTINNIHYVAEHNQLVPAAATEFARDAAFGYHSSNLCAWVAEKTGGTVPADHVAAVSLETIRRGGPDAVAEQLCALAPGAVCVVNAASQRDLDVVALAVLQAETQGRTFLARTAASYVAARIGLAPRPLLRAVELGLPPAGGGLVVVGSYVPKTTAQLDVLLTQPGVVGIELDVAALLDDGQQRWAIAEAAAQIDTALRAGSTVVAHTSRVLVTGAGPQQSLGIGNRISHSLVALVQSLTVRPRYLIAKGGITSSDLATKALGVRRATVLGQLLPGVPVWRLGPESRAPGLAYVVFPGNVGGAAALSEAVRTMKDEG